MNWTITTIVLCTLILSCAGQAAWYYDNWCGGSLQYLDDKNCAKVFPGNTDRDAVCPTPMLSTVPEGYVLDGDLTSVPVDTTSLRINDTAVKVCLIMTKRVLNASSSSGISLYNKYFCTPSAVSETYETWSSSKIFAVANAAGHLRTNETSCAQGLFGLTSSTSGKHGPTLLADLATIICSYDHTAGYSSNSLSSYFHDLGFRDRINVLLHDWLGVGAEQTLGGNYGEATPADLGFGISTAEQTCAADKDPWPMKYDNSITALTAAELTRRIALHRELAPGMRFPGTLWTDMQHLLYGAEESALFPGQVWGGMSADTAVFLQSVPAVAQLLSLPANSKDFRIFSKLGAGFSSSRYKGEIVSNAHICLPSRGGAADGVEFTVSVEGSVANDSSLTKVEQHVAQAMQAAADFALSLP